MPSRHAKNVQPVPHVVARRFTALMHSALQRAYSPLRTLLRTRLNFSHAAALLLAAASIVSAEELRDPTRPHTYTVERATVAGVPRFSINAIFVSDERRLAIINGERVQVGDRVSGATVVSIEKEQVTLSVSGKQFTARLKTRRP